MAGRGATHRFVRAIACVRSGLLGLRWAWIRAECPAVQLLGGVYGRDFKGVRHPPQSFWPLLACVSSFSASSGCVARFATRERPHLVFLDERRTTPVGVISAVSSQPVGPSCDSCARPTTAQFAALRATAAESRGGLPVATNGCACRWWRQATRARARSARSRRGGTGRTPSCSLSGTSRSEPAGSGRGANLRSPAATSKWNLPSSQRHQGC